MQAINHELGEHEATLKLILDKIDAVEQKMERIQEELAELRGGKKAAGVLGGIVGGVVGLFSSICTILFGFGGVH